MSIYVVKLHFWPLTHHLTSLLHISQGNKVFFLLRVSSIYWTGSRRSIWCRPRSDVESEDCWTSHDIDGAIWRLFNKYLTSRHLFRIKLRLQLVCTFLPVIRYLGKNIYLLSLSIHNSWLVIRFSKGIVLWIRCVSVYSKPEVKYSLIWLRVSLIHWTNSSIHLTNRFGSGTLRSRLRKLTMGCVSNEFYSVVDLYESVFNGLYSVPRLLTYFYVTYNRNVPKREIRNP